MRGFTRSFALGLVLTFIGTACTAVSTASPSPTVAASATSDRPKLELSTYQYALQTKGKIRIGTQEDNTPFSVKNPATGKWDGFDVAYGREIAKSIFGSSDDPDKYIEYVPVTSATRIPSLTDNKVDVIIKTFTINDDRKKQIDFTDVYFKTGQRILVKKDNTSIKEAADLAGKTVGVTRGTIEDSDLARIAPKDTSVRRFDDNNATIDALLSGQVQLIATGSVVAATLAQKNPGKVEKKFVIRDSPAHIGVRRGEPDVVAWLNVFIYYHRKAGGELDALARKWFGEPLPVDAVL